ncbi:cellulase family glycosylhydrolase [Streptacidiphilus monticola]
MWRGYQPHVVDEELAVLKAHGLNLTRSFFYWPDFMPAPDRVDEELCAHYADFLDRHQAHGLRTVPTFIVGHMSGENWDPVWRNGRDLYTDVWMVGRQAWFAKEMTRRFKDHPAVAAWLVTNEMPIYGARETATPETVSAWSEAMVNAVRAAGATQPVSLGDGAWGLENSGHDNGFRLRHSAEVCDFLGPHVYRMEDDPVRQHHAAAWACELSSTFGLPVVLEEFGVSSDFVSGANAAHYYRQVLHNSLLAGATGWVAWNNTDYDDLAHQPPYLHHAFEMHFGLTDRHGRAKPQLLEMRRFGELLDRIDAPRVRRADSDTALVVTSYLDTLYPFTRAEDRAAAHTVLRQAWVSARLADAPPALTRESEGLAEGARLYLVPSVKQLLSPPGTSWRSVPAPGPPSTSPTPRQPRRAARSLVRAPRRTVRRAAPVGVRPGQPDRGRGGRVHADPALRHPGRGRGAPLPCRRGRQLARLPPRRPHGRGSARRGRPRPTGPAAAPGGRGQRRALHLSHRTDGRGDPARQPRGHQHPLRRPGRPCRGAPTGQRRRPARGRGPTGARGRPPVRLPGEPDPHRTDRQALPRRRRFATDPRRHTRRPAAPSPYGVFVLEWHPLTTPLMPTESTTTDRS